MLEHYVTQFYQGEVMVRELYYSPDNSMVLVLKEVGEQPFGFPYYSGKVRRLKRDRTIGRVLKSFRRRWLLSPGAFGCNYDHWSGSPWSDDSRSLALAETLGQTYDAFRLNIVDLASGEETVVMEADEIVSHHLWSSLRAYLFRSMTDWYLYTLESGKMRTIYSGRKYPKHCYFVDNGAHLLLLDDDGLISVLACDSLEQITSASVAEHLRAGGAINFSVPDPFENRILLGINARYSRMTPAGPMNECERWLSVSTSPG